jgi:hypothetical protein
MEMIGAIENMNLTLKIPDDSIAAEIALVDRRARRQSSPVSTLHLEYAPEKASRRRRRPVAR